MRVEKITRRSRKLVAVLLAALFLVPTAKVRGQTLEFRGAVPLPGDLTGTALQSDARFGHGVASIGDVNNDGVPDFVVGAPQQMVGDVFQSGQAFVISGADGLRIHTLDNPVLDGSTPGFPANAPSMFANFGWAVAGMDDVNGDGVPDVAVGAPFQQVGGLFDVGRVFVFSGRNGRLLDVVDNPGTAPEQVEGGSFGWALTTVGDLNGDGVRDLAVGAPTVQGPRSQGRAFVFSGATGDALRVLDNPTAPTSSNFFAFFGGSVAGVGDLNGDGVEDVAVGAPDQDGGRGRVYVYSGVLAADGSTVVLGELRNPVTTNGGSFGDALALVGDVDGDGVADLAVGAPRQTRNGVVGVGQVFVFAGTAAVSGGMFSAVPVRTLDTPNATPNINTLFGSALAAVGDVNGDGFADLAIGARGEDGSDEGCGVIACGAGVGRVYVLSGAAPDPSVPDAGTQVLAALDNPGTPVTGNANHGYQVVVVENAGGEGERFLAASAPGQAVVDQASGEVRTFGQVFLYSLPAGGGGTEPPDTTAPTLETPGNIFVEATSTSGAVVTYNVTATDAGQAITPVCSPASGSTFAIGATTVHCTATDPASNSATASFVVTVRDSTPPQTQLVSAVDGHAKAVSNGGATVSDDITITFGGTDAIGVTGYYCAWDGAAATPCTSPLSRSNLSTGQHVFSVQARDGRGNVDESPATFTWRILTKAEAAKELKEAVKDLELSRREHAKLSGLLREIRERLSNRKRSDDKRACDELDSFLKRVGNGERSGVLTAAQAGPLRQLAESLRTSVGCRGNYWHAGHYKHYKHR